MDNEMRKRLAEKSGDSGSSRPPKYVCPLIRFDGNRGEFRKITKNADNENVEESIKTPLEFVILKKRRLLSSFSPTQSLFTSEHNTTSDRLMLFKVIGKTVSLETTGFTDELREKYQTLKTHEVIYVLYDGEVCKMEIKGGSLGSYYDFQKSLQSEEKHSFEVTTVVSSEKTKSEGGFSYFKMTFDFKEYDGDFTVVEDKIDEVSKACNDADAYTKQKLNEKSKPSVSGNTNTLTAAEVERIQALKKNEKDWQELAGSDEINPSDIPF